MTGLGTEIAKVAPKYPVHIADARRAVEEEDAPREARVSLARPLTLGGCVEHQRLKKDVARRAPR
jgi:hypothetical protein